MDRREWSEEQCYCHLCGYSSFSGANLDTHEMCSGPSRQAALTEPAAWLRLCGGFANGCHERLQGIPELAVPLALKKLADPEHYNRVKVNRLRGRADVTEAEVDAVVAYLKRHVGGRRTLAPEQAAAAVDGARLAAEAARKGK